MTWMKTMQTNTIQFNDVKVGDKLPEQAIPITVALIASGAIATRDFFRVTTTKMRRKS